MRRFAAVLLVIILLSLFFGISALAAGVDKSTGGGAEEYVKFNDIGGHWARESIESLASRHIVMGRGGDCFFPDENITRAELAAMLVRALKPESINSGTKFSDLSGQWFADEVSAASMAELVYGRDDGNFWPDQNVFREETALILCRSMELAGFALKEDADSDASLDVFQDQGEIDENLKRFVSICLKAGIMTGNEKGEFKPSAYTTRAEAASMLDRLLTHIKGVINIKPGS